MYREAILSVPKVSVLAYAPILVRNGILVFHGKYDNGAPRSEPEARESPSQPSEGTSERQAKSGGKAITAHTRGLLVRLKSSHQNQLEMLGLYAAAVALAVAVRVDSDTVTRLTGWYVKGRIAYTLAYAAPQVANGALRSLAFFASCIPCVMLYFTAANAASTLFS